MTITPSAFLTVAWTWDIRFSTEDNCFLVTVSEFPDFVAAGDSPGEAAANSREALISHIEGYLATNRELPMPLLPLLERPRVPAREQPVLCAV